jgi:hypothetical protein
MEEMSIPRLARAAKTAEAIIGEVARLLTEIRRAGKTSHA